MQPAACAAELSAHRSTRASDACTRTRVCVCVCVWAPAPSLSASPGETLGGWSRTHQCVHQYTTIHSYNQSTSRTISIVYYSSQSQQAASARHPSLRMGGGVCRRVSADVVRQRSPCNRQPGQRAARKRQQQHETRDAISKSSRLSRHGQLNRAVVCCCARASPPRPSRGLGTRAAPG